VRRTLLLPAVALVIGLLAAGCGGSSGDSAAATQETTVSTDATTTARVGAGGCTDVAVPPARKDGGATAPVGRLDPAKTYKLVFDTNCGTFTVTLDPKSAPATSASLVSLAKARFFDDTIFHRIVPGFVIQGGDPTQLGNGGPGYQTVDPPGSGARYVKGVVAMGKTATEPAGTSGSQFFVVTGADVGLPPEYAIVGKVTHGLPVVTRIGTLGDRTTERPTRPVVITSVKVEEQ
jgi:peptidyl-prolyl cis-trans isomerase B (cyclophilin B)